MYEHPNRTVLKENVSPQTRSQSPSNQFMVLRGGTIPPLFQSFPGMEHEQTLFNGLPQETPSDRISDLIGFDEEQEIEAAAAASEAHMKSPFVSTTSVVTSATVPSVNSTDIAPNSIQKPTLSPLHISISECPKVESSGANSELLSNGSTNKKRFFQQPSVGIAQPTANSAAPIIMGPPSSSTTQIMLSPAGNYHNGFQRLSSDDPAPSSPGFSNRYLSKGSQQTHPLAVPRTIPANRPAPSSSLEKSTGRQLSSLASPVASGRKDHEMTRRRALVDRITKSRGPDYIHLMSQTEGLSHTQTSILLRKHRGTLQSNNMPCSLQRLIDCSSEPDKSQELFVQKIKEANQKRARHHDIDELTDVSDLDDDLEDPKVETEERTSSKNIPRWTPKRIRYSGMLARAETLLSEKIALMGMLKNQKTVMDSSCGVRFTGEEIIPRRRRQLNGMYYLYDKTPFRRASAASFGCSRTMPIQSWTERKLQKSVFEGAKNERSQSSSSNAVLKPSSNPKEKWVATAQYETVSHLTNGEKREVTEYDYEEYKAGEGLQRVNELSSLDPMEFIASSDFTTFEDRLMTYMYRMSTAPSSTIRKKHDKSIYFETDDRKNSERNTSVKLILRKKADKKKERKRLEEESSDEEEEAKPAQKRGRGRPVASRKKTSKASNSSNPHHGIYLDYLFEDFMNEDICVKQLPSKITYAHIHVPQWSSVPENYWDDVSNVGESSEDLLDSVAKQHHRLMHLERERIRAITEKRIRNRQGAQKSAAATPAHNSYEDGDEDSSLPPFDMLQFEPKTISSRRRFSSVAKPFEPRDFPSKPKTESTN